ncbi:hypothetical protein ACFX13_046226 [Malus domestica]
MDLQNPRDNQNSFCLSLASDLFHLFKQNTTNFLSLYHYLSVTITPIQLADKKRENKIFRETHRETARKEISQKLKADSASFAIKRKMKNCKLCRTRRFCDRTATPRFTAPISWCLATPGASSATAASLPRRGKPPAKSSATLFRCAKVVFSQTEAETTT